jgi:general secretion pathway protein D
MLLLFSAIGAVYFLFSPAAASAARIAGEDQTVTTTAPSAASVGAQEKEGPVKPALQTPASVDPGTKKIKVIGNRDSKRYHLPGMTYYDKVEAYHRVEFDSEEAAIRAGYRKAPNGRNDSRKKPEAATRQGSEPAGAKQPPFPPAAAPSMQNAAAPLPSTPAEAQPSRPEKPVRRTPAGDPAGKGARFVTIDFDNVDIQVFIKFISELTGKNFIFDDRVKGKVTVVSPKKIAVSEVYKVFESVLDVNGFTTVPSGDVIKIVPAQIAKEKSLATRAFPDDVIPSEDKMATQIVSLEHASPDEMKRVLDPLISKSSIILSYPPTGMLVITDALSNIKRLQKIIDTLDVEGAGETITYIPLKYASAADTLKSLVSVFQQQKGTLAPVKIVSDERTNAVIIAATENDTIRVKELIALMDKEIPKGTGMIRVYYLQNARAEETAKVLTTLPQQAKLPDGRPAAVSKSVQIVADKATNSLIITADTADYQVIEDVIRKLDIARAMVYLEALIMEVNANKNFKLGVEWMGAVKISESYTGIGSSSGEGGTFPISSGLLTPSATGTTSGTSTGTVTSLPSLASGLTLGVIGQAIKIATVGGADITFPNLAAFVHAYQADTDIHILATPQLLTLDNEEAEMTVGKNVPYVTRQDTTTTSTINYSSYEYKDVGITLKVTPQINKEGFVRLKLDQSVTKLESQSQDAGTGQKILAPTTLKRTAKTTVTVRSGDTVVIGGLIEDSTSDSFYKVPLLGDIPLLGWLFKYKTKVGDKTNLFIFITPRIIQKPEDATDIHQDKKDYMHSLQEGTIKVMPQRKP